MKPIHLLAFVILTAFFGGGALLLALTHALAYLDNDALSNAVGLACGFGIVAPFAFLVWLWRVRPVGRVERRTIDAEYRVVR